MSKERKTTVTQATNCNDPNGLILFWQLAAPFIKEYIEEKLLAIYDIIVKFFTENYVRISKSNQVKVFPVVASRFSISYLMELYNLSYPDTKLRELYSQELVRDDHIVDT